MKMSTRGREALKKREGCPLKAYRCSAGVLTIGVGHTSAAGPPEVKEGMTITAQEADEILTRDLAKFEGYVNNALFVPVTQNEFDAMVSICFNVGPKFAQSTCIKHLNAKNRRAVVDGVVVDPAAEAIMLWNKPPEIIGRRRSEYQQFKTPYPGLAPVKKTGSNAGAIAAGATTGAGAAAAAQQAGLPMWAIALIVAGFAVAAFLIWKFKR